MAPLVITCANLKGGTGKTTTAIALASAASYGAPTVLIDCDPQGSAADWAARAADAGQPLRAAVRSMPAADLARRMGPLTAGYGVAIVDAPPPGALAIARNAIDVADILVVPCPPNFADLARVPATVDEARQRNIPAGVVLTMVRAGLADRGAAISALAGADVQVFSTWLPLTVAVARAYGQQVTGVLAAFGIALMGEILTMKEAQPHA